jgi:hypothetical protein
VINCILSGSALALGLAATLSAAQLTLEQVETDRAHMDLLRSRLRVMTPGTSHPTVTVLSPSRSGGIDGSVHTTQADRRGRPDVSPSSRLAWVIHTVGLSSRMDFDDLPVAQLLRNSRASNPRSLAREEIRLAVELDDRAPLEIDNMSRAGDSAWAGSLAESLVSEHEHLYEAEDWMVFDLLHEVLDLRICDDVSAPSVGVTTCYDTFAQLTRRPNAPRRYQIKIGCLQGCGEALINLGATYDGAGKLRSMSAAFLLGDPRFDLRKELVVSFREPTAPGFLSTFTSGDLRVDAGSSVGSSTISFSDLYRNAHPSHLDPGADRSSP